jgi:pimeloyl-ACP methyl ester carboxylesterase
LWDIGYQTEVRIDGNGPAIVLIHGTPLALDAWDGLVDVLSGDVRLLRYDLRGHGAAKAEPLPGSYGVLVDDLRRLLDDCGIKRAHVVGHSFGGQVAARFARVHPDRLTSLTTVCSRMTPYPPFAKAADRIEAGGYAEVVGGVMRRWFPDQLGPSEPDGVRYTRTAFKRARPASFATALRLISAFDLGGDLESTAAPIRFVSAEDDQVVTAPDLLAAAARVPSGSFSLLRSCNHMVPVERPDRVAELIRETLSAA